jgi:transposase-like protein
VAHTTIMRWVQRYLPDFEKRWQRYARSMGTSWRIDETYIKIKGKWGYLYRGVDKGGQTIDFFLSARRDSAAAERFLQQAIEKRGTPRRLRWMATK